MEIYLINPFQKGYKPKMFNIRDLSLAKYGIYHVVAALLAIVVPVLIAGHPEWQTTSISVIVIGVYNAVEQYLSK